MQQEYEGLASIYDYLVAEISYEDWFAYLQEILAKLDCTPSIVADLACGTGKTTIPFAELGISSYGIDISGEMLEIARQKVEDQDYDIKFLEQDMKKLDLPVQVELMVCYHDGLNYILSLTELYQVFKKVNENLLKGGYFIFDLNTVNRFAKADNEEVTIIDEGEKFLVWKTDYDSSQEIWTIDLTGFVEVEAGLYQRFEEIHKEKHYSEGEVLTALRKTGFKVIDYYEAFTWQKPDYNSPRIFYIAQKV
ncbi:class I SAM-dependent DNA methyltransferase [Fuchsiella alkaliacetigena]|uniref:class I SAM-dependent DNA methyltransferase n=1 Tax=Fuchsiella alkaliacetigena TaxID=957042 RepID=UPI00200A94A8|nr:class I SAM-dependent methyltransferase [Fuchsiella alkaliacetigena]MCK8823755.1 class I SAM-dependent methyltransferase [Fuchsiella alkaliacetigena]